MGKLTEDEFKQELIEQDYEQGGLTNFKNWNFLAEKKLFRLIGNYFFTVRLLGDGVELYAAWLPPQYEDIGPIPIITETEHSGYDISKFNTMQAKVATYIREIFNQEVLNKLNTEKLEALLEKK